MARPAKTRSAHSQRSKRVSREELDGLIDEATIDAYGESEQATGFYTMLEDHLQMPFKASVLGLEVTVEQVDIADDDQIVAVCRRRKSRQHIPILALALPDPPPTGWKWIIAYRQWASGKWNGPVIPSVSK